MRMPTPRFCVAQSRHREPAVTQDPSARTPTAGPRPARRSRSRRLLTWLGLAACVALLYLLAPRVVTPRMLQTDDYVEYWAAARLNLAGENPYSPELLTPLQHQTGRFFEVPVMMWNPPFVLPLVMPLAPLPYPASRLLWLVLNVGLLFWCAETIWRLYGGPRSRRWLGWLLAFASIPTLNALGSGQIPVLILVGMVGFLLFERRGQGWAAGAFAALTAVKPQTLYLFWIVLVLWAVSRRRWPVLAGAGLSMLALTAAAWAFNPSVVTQYAYAATHYPPLDWATPTIGGSLRMLFGPEHRWLQFVALPLGVGWLLFHWRTSRATWDWQQELPLVATVSLVTAAYAWSCDLVVFILPLLQVAVWVVLGSRRRTAFLAGGSYLAISILAVALHGRVVDFWFMWLPPVLLLWYWVWRRQMLSTPASISGSAEAVGPLRGGDSI
jgi:hypothetical protein